MKDNKRGSIKIGNSIVGDGHPCYVVAEIGINHNGDMEVCKKLINAAKEAGCNCVKFQKRCPDRCVPKEQTDIKKETPWGIMTYLEYKRKLEFGDKEFQQIAEYCARHEIDWFASCWDEESADFMDRYSPACYKIASASLTDDELLKHVQKKGRPVILSTGMSTVDQINHAISLLNENALVVMHSTSIYPCPPEYLNLNVIKSLRNTFNGPVGYSGHEVGLSATVAAVALGANVVERHITLDRAMWGTDQAASVEPHGLLRMIRDIRVVEQALGDGKKVVYEGERPMIEKLRRVR